MRQETTKASRLQDGLPCLALAFVAPGSPATRRFRGYVGRIGNLSTANCETPETPPRVPCRLSRRGAAPKTNVLLLNVAEARQRSASSLTHTPNMAFDLSALSSLTWRQSPGGAQVPCLKHVLGFLLKTCASCCSSRWLARPCPATRNTAHARLRSMSARPTPSRAWRLATRGARVMKNSREARSPRIQETWPVANPALRHDTQTDCNWGPVNRAAPPGLRQWSQG